MESDILSNFLPINVVILDIKISAETDIFRRQYCFPQLLAETELGVHMPKYFRPKHCRNSVVHYCDCEGGGKAHAVARGP